MAYFDGFLDDQDQQNGYIANLLKRRPSPLMTELPRGSRGYDLSVSATNPPRVPPFTTQPTNEPRLGMTVPETPPSLGGAAPTPVRPNVMPQQSDFEAKPELGGWKKLLGLGAGFALGSPQLVDYTLHGQQEAANRQYQGAMKDWQQQQADKLRSAQTEKLEAETAALRNPKPEKPENLQQIYADEIAAAQARGEDPSKNVRVQQLQDAITALQ